MFKTGSPILQKVVDDLTRISVQEALPKAVQKAVQEALPKAVQEAERKATETSVITVLVARFGAEAGVLRAELETLHTDRLKNLLSLAATCPDLDSFRKELAPRRSKRKT
jgi:hypothetical protein